MGKNHWNYKNGKYKFLGYWMILRADGKGYIKNHILVAEIKLGRPLLKEEVVHHINGLRDDDRPKNLWIFPNNKSHGIYEGNLHKTYKKWIQQDYNLTILPKVEMRDGESQTSYGIQPGRWGEHKKLTKHDLLKCLKKD